MLLTIDIGGTHTRLATCNYEVGAAIPKNIKIYNSTAYQGVEEIIKDYADSMQISAKYAVIGVPGPVVNGSAKATNLPWIIDEQKLKAALMLSEVKLINDVEALGYSIEVLDEDDHEIINTGRHHAGSPIALIAPGTGLGESFLIHHENSYKVYASEGGHSDFAPTNTLEIKLLDYLLNRSDHVSYERVCSGKGLYNIYKFLRDEHICIEPDRLKDLLIKTGDPAKLISQNALSGKTAQPITVKTIDTFVEILGAEAGNMAMRYNAKNGVYIGGGIVPKIRPLIKKDLFMKSFKRKGRLSGYVSDIPVKVIRKPEANLYGLANFALKAMKVRPIGYQC
ncbi:glucokinase [Thermodesulfobacteriota bacterium]